MAVFFYFSVTVRHTEPKRPSQRGHKNRHFKPVYFKFVFCKICSLKQLFSNRQFKDSISIQSKTHNSLNLSSMYQPPIILQLFFHIFNYSNCCFSCVAIKIAVFCRFIRRFQELLGLLHNFLMIFYVAWFCFSEKITFGHPFYGCSNVAKLFEK